MTETAPVLEVDAPVKGNVRVASSVSMGAQRAGVAGSASILAVYYGLRFLESYGLVPPEGSDELVHLKLLIGAVATGLVMGLGKLLRDHGYETVF